MIGRHPEQRGFVLVSVLWLMAILTVISAGFGRRALLDAKAAVYGFDHTQAVFQARGAVERGIVELRNMYAVNHYYDKDGYFGPDQPWAYPKDLYDEGIFVRGEDFQGDSVTYYIEDEDRRIDLNRADEATLDKTGLSRSVIRKIMHDREWSDDPDAPPPLRFDTVQQIRLMADLSDDEWFGTKNKPGLKDLFTVWGTGQVNINTASEAVLQCIPELGDSAVRKIVGYRQGGDGKLGTDDDKSFKTLDEVQNEAGVNGDSMNAVRTYCKVSSQFFTITGVATQRNGAVAATAQATVDASGAVQQWREDPVGW